MTSRDNPSFSDRRAILKAASAVLIGAGGGLLPFSTGQAATPFASNRLSIARRGALGPDGGRDVILIPGLASSPAIWNGLVAQLPGHRLHLVHIGGFAHLPAGPNASGPLLAPLVDELARYINTQGLVSPVLVGHSMGGMLAMMLALRTGSPVTRLMVVDMLPEGAAMIGGTSQGLGYLAEQLNGYFSGTRAGRQLLAQMVMETPGAEGSDPRVISQALAELAQTNLSPRLPLIRQSLNVVYALPADRDMAASQRQRYQAAYAKAPAAKLTGIGPSGHAVMLDQPARFAASVQQFLK